MGIIAIIICILAVLLFRLLPSKGKAGEKRVASILKRLPEDNYKVINDLLLSSNGYSTQIDHIVISIYASSSSRPSSIKVGFTEAKTANTGHRTSTATNTNSAIRFIKTKDI